MAIPSAKKRKNQNQKNRQTLIVSAELRKQNRTEIKASFVDCWISKINLNSASLKEKQSG